MTGGRDFTNRAELWRALDALRPDVLIHGSALGADTLADEWAKDFKERGFSHFGNWQLNVIREPVTKQEWDMLGKMAGNARNQRMLRHKPDLVLACPGGRGTSDMIHRAHDAGIPVLRLFVEG